MRTRPRRSRPPPAAASSSAAASLSFAWEERDGFTWGELELAGEAADAGSTYRVWSKNENLLAWRDGVPDVTAPDLICCFADPTGEPVTNPHHQAGGAVTVVGVPAAPQWRTPGRRGDARPEALRVRPRLRAARGARARLRLLLSRAPEHPADAAPAPDG